MVPGISKWNMYAGGTAAAPGKHSFDLYLPVGRYLINPVSTTRGMHLGYRLYFLNEKGTLQGGLWQEIGSETGLHRSPQSAASAARAHYQAHFGARSNPARGVQKCQWFLNCKNRAVTTQRHPILGEVPICERCKALYGSMSKPRPRSNPRVRRGPMLSVPEQHQLRIARRTLQMPGPMAAVMGGPTKAQARGIVRRLTGRSYFESSGRCPHCDADIAGHSYTESSGRCPRCDKDVLRENPLTRSEKAKLRWKSRFWSGEAEEAPWAERGYYEGRAQESREIAASYNPLPKEGVCRIEVVTQGRCRRKATALVEMGLKAGPLQLCEKCAQYVLRSCPTTAKRMPSANPLLPPPFIPPNPRALYEIWVGNIGRVYSGHSKAEAERTYREYVSQSKSGYGRAAGEPVDFMIDGEIVRSYAGEPRDENPPPTRGRFLRERLADPRLFQRGSFRTITPRPGYRVIIGRPIGSTKTRAQAILRPMRDVFRPELRGRRLTVGTGPREVRVTPATIRRAKIAANPRQTIASVTEYLRSRGLKGWTLHRDPHGYFYLYHDHLPPTSSIGGVYHIGDLTPEEWYVAAKEAVDREASRNPYVGVDRRSGRISFVERGSKRAGGAWRAREWAEEVQSYTGRPQDVYYRKHVPKSLSIGMSARRAQVAANPEIVDPQGRVVQSSRNLRGIREYVSKNIVKLIEVLRLPSWEKWDALLRVWFENGNIYATPFADFEVLKDFVRRWRNVYGAPLSVNLKPSGVVSFDNPALAPKVRMPGMKNPLTRDEQMSIEQMASIDDAQARTAEERRDYASYRYHRGSADTARSISQRFGPLVQFRPKRPPLVNPLPVSATIIPVGMMNPRRIERNPLLQTVTLAGLGNPPGTYIVVDRNGKILAERMASGVGMTQAEVYEDAVFMAQRVADVTKDTVWLTLTTDEVWVGGEFDVESQRRRGIVKTFLPRYDPTSGWSRERELGLPNPSRQSLLKEARRSLTLARGDVRAGHTGAAEYWKGRAAGLSQAALGNPRGCMTNPAGAFALAEKFAGGATSGRAGAFYIHGNRLYSYGAHFPVAERMPDGTIIVTTRSAPSRTTAAHVGAILRATPRLMLQRGDLAPEASGPSGYSNPRPRRMAMVGERYSDFPSIEKKIVLRRLRAGKPVPAAVMKWYPELRALQDNPRKAHTEIVQAFFAGRRKSIGPRYRTDGTRLLVWGNLVAEKRPEGIFISDAGWKTLLTKTVLNTVLDHAAANGYQSGGIVQERFEWFLIPRTPEGYDRSRRIDWTGSMILRPIGAAASNPLTDEEARHTLALAKGHMKSAHQLLKSKDRRAGGFASLHSAEAYGMAEAVYESLPEESRKTETVKRYIDAAHSQMYKGLRQSFTEQNPRGSTRLDELRAAASAVGLHVATWSPGDGVTRYRFFIRPGNSYFGPDNGIYTALGLKEAQTFVQGYAARRGMPNPLTRREVAQVLRRAKDVARTARRAREFGRTEEMKRQLSYGMGMLDTAQSLTEKGRARRAIGKMMTRYHYISPRPSSRENPVLHKNFVPHEKLPPDLKKAIKEAESASFTMLSVWDIKGNVVTLDPRPEDPVAVENAESEMKHYGYTVRWSDEKGWFGLANPLPGQTYPSGPIAFNVYLGTKLIDTVFYSPSVKVTPEEVQRSLIEHDGYDPGIRVVRHRVRRTRRNPLTRRETAHHLGRARFMLGVARTARSKGWLRHAAWMAGKASGRADVIYESGPRRFAGFSGAAKIQRRADSLRNPLTRREAREAFRLEEEARITAGKQRSQRLASHYHGRAYGYADAVSEFGPRDMRREAVLGRSEAAMMGGALYRNPAPSRAPWKEGQKIPVEKARAWVRSLKDPELSRQFEQAYKLQTKANRKPRFVIWRTVQIGSPRKLDAVTAMVQYGETPETIYRPPKGSHKGGHKLYRHEWGEGTGRKKPVPVLASASGQAIVMPLGRGQTVGDWMRG